MKSILERNPAICFNLFAILIASRDVFTQRLLLQSLDPIHVLFVFCLVTMSAALIFNVLFRRGSAITKLTSFEDETVYSKLLLGVATWLAFLATMFGIKFLGAPIFSLIEHALIPVLSLVLAARFLSERMNMRMKIACFILGIGLILFLTASIDGSDVSAINDLWLGGVVLAIIGAFLTATNSAFQKKLVTAAYAPDEVLFIRFLLPTFLMGILCLLNPKGAIPSDKLLDVGFIAGFTFALPLVFLCLGFARASMVRFSAFNFLIPAYTFILGPIAVQGELEKLKNPWLLTGIVAMAAGYLLFESDSILMTFRRNSKLQEGLGK
jgi:drug/metabolite transporter (DMT)-like permease